MLLRQDFVTTLLEKGANPVMINNDEKTALQLAKNDTVKNLLQGMVRDGTLTESSHRQTDRLNKWIDRLNKQNR